MIKEIESNYPLALRLSSKSKVQMILWFISWQLNNPNQKLVIDKQRLNKLLGHEKAPIPD